MPKDLDADISDPPSVGPSKESLKGWFSYFVVASVMFVVLGLASTIGAPLIQDILPFGGSSGQAGVPVNRPASN